MKRARHEKKNDKNTAMDTTDNTSNINTDINTTNTNKKAKLINNTTPYHILFAQQLPNSVTIQDLTSICCNYIGFKEVRSVPNKDIAFIEFEDHTQSTVALEQLNNFKLNSNNELLYLTYSKQ